jgi:hypothetical protein
MHKSALRQLMCGLAQSWRGSPPRIGACVSTHPAGPKQANISSKKETRVFKFIRKIVGIVAGVAKRLPLFQPASISRELEQTLCLVRSCRQQGEKAAARRPVSAP